MGADGSTLTLFAAGVMDLTASGTAVGFVVVEELDEPPVPPELPVRLELPVFDCEGGEAALLVRVMTKPTAPPIASARTTIPAARYGEMPRRVS